LPLHSSKAATPDWGFRIAIEEIFRRHRVVIAICLIAVRVLRKNPAFDRSQIAAEKFVGVAQRETAPTPMARFLHQGH
jgi:hypothetical protein